LKKAQHLRLPTTFNKNGRAYADLTALGFNLNVVLGGHITVFRLEETKKRILNFLKFFELFYYYSRLEEQVLVVL
jgi:hypothetical protein